MYRLARASSVVKFLTTPNYVNWISRREQFSSAAKNGPSSYSSFTAKGAIPAWRAFDRRTTEQTRDGMPIEDWHKGVYSHYIDAQLKKIGQAEHLARLQHMHSRVLRIRNTLDREIDECDEGEDGAHEAGCRHYKQFAEWSLEVISGRIAEVEAYKREFKAAEEERNPPVSNGTLPSEGDWKAVGLPPKQ
ncbi:hypothetical protein F4781DRAFT_361428 [Annulohypoxylon bovei var. microspora]|nr:hypothetical protein F4781DRAFT_361428 [Annulohypoxylon bovei var. microspora]